MLPSPASARRAWLLAAALTLTACDSVPAGKRAGDDDSALGRVRSSGVLRWGGDQQGGEPFVFQHPTQDRLTGFEVELADAIAAQLGVRARFVQNDWSNLIPSLERKTFDVAMNGLEVTPARAGRVLFSRPYYLFTERLVARADDPTVTDLASLRGRRVGTLASSQAWDMLLAGGATAIPYEGVEEPFIDLQHRRTAAVLLDDIIVDRYAGRHPGLRVVGDIADGRYAIAVRRGDEDLLSAIDAALTQLITTGQLRQILQRYQVDNPRQAALAVAGPTRSPAEAAGIEQPRIGPPRRLNLAQLWLFLQGAGVTFLISLGAMALAVPLGIALTTVRMTMPRVSWLATAYVELFRGTPVLLQLYLIYYGLAATLSLDAWTAAIVGLGLNYAAYEAEVYRGALAGVPPSQLETARALGMPTPMALRTVVMPQALRIALPGMTNDFISLLKDSSLVSVITVVELTKRMTITAVDMRSWLIPGALCAALYFAMSYPLSRLARRLERHLQR